MNTTERLKYLSDCFHGWESLDFDRIKDTILRRLYHRARIYYIGYMGELANFGHADEPVNILYNILKKIGDVLPFVERDYSRGCFRYHPVSPEEVIWFARLFNLPIHVKGSKYSPFVVYAISVSRYSYYYYDIDESQLSDSKPGSLAIRDALKNVPDSKLSLVESIREDKRYAFFRLFPRLLLE